MGKKIVLFLSWLLLSSAIFLQKSGVIERGIGAMIENSASSEQSLALHRFLQIGKTYYLKNPANNLETAVKIIGRLPNTGANEKVIIRISQKSYQKLNLRGKKFAIEILTNPSTKKITHEIDEGETLYSIAKKYNVSLEKLRKWNELKYDSVSTGQKITIYKTYRVDD